MCLDPALFRPVAAAGPSGLRDRPRPFVIRAAHLDGGFVSSGESFEFTLIVFAALALAPLRHAFEQVCRQGITPAGVQLELLDWRQEELLLDLRPRASAPERVRVRFETPTELKGWSHAGLPPFEVLAARLRDRIGALRALYGGGPLALDFAGFAARAALIATTAGDWQRHEAWRRSLRTGLRHPLGGLRGWVDYEGDLREFLPYLEAGAWTGVGRQTVWGKGVISVAAPE